MFELSLDWWEFPARAAMVYIALLLMVRVSGKRTVGQFTPFDLLVVVLLSEAVSNGLTGGDESVTGGLLLALTLVALNTLVAFVSSRGARLERAIEGRAVLIGRDGAVFEPALKRHRVGLGEFERALREADCPLGEMKRAFLEADGNISIVRNEQAARDADKA